METTDQQKALIDQAILKKAANKRKWAYLIFDIVEQKRALDISYGDIAEWLTMQGLEIGEHVLRKQIWDYKRRLKERQQNPKKMETIHAEPVTSFPEPVKTEELQNNTTIDLSDELRRRTHELQKENSKKNSGFDAFKRFMKE